MKITIATPMYGGNCQGPFVVSLLSLIKKLETNGHTVIFTALYNESLINRARNSLTNSFLRSDHDKLVFIDGDETFDADGTYKMMNAFFKYITQYFPNVNKIILTDKSSLNCSNTTISLYMLYLLKYNSSYYEKQFNFIIESMPQIEICFGWPIVLFSAETNVVLKSHIVTSMILILI